MGNGRGDSPLLICYPRIKVTENILTVGRPPCLPLSAWWSTDSFSLWRPCPASSFSPARSIWATSSTPTLLSEVASTLVAHKSSSGCASPCGWPAPLRHPLPRAMAAALLPDLQALREALDEAASRRRRPPLVRRRHLQRRHRRRRRLPARATILHGCEPSADSDDTTNFPLVQIY